LEDAGIAGGGQCIDLESSGTQRTGRSPMRTGLPKAP
jgi:hypothetical protein